MDHEANGDIAFVCGLGWDETRWRRPLRPGDLIHAESELLDKRPSGSRHGPRRPAVSPFSVRLEDGTVLLSFFGINFVYTRAGAAQAKAADQPLSGSR